MYRLFLYAVKGKCYSSYRKILLVFSLYSNFLYSLKENTLETKDLKDFPLATTAFSFNCLKEKSVHKVTKDFPLGQLQSHNSITIHMVKGSLTLQIVDSQNMSSKFQDYLQCNRKNHVTASNDHTSFQLFFLLQVFRLFWPILLDIGERIGN